MRNQLFLCIVIAIYLRGMHLAKKATPKDVAVLLFFVYAFYHSFKVENLSAADGFTTDIDKEAYTNLHKIVSELYKNDTLTIPGHLHVKGNLHVGDKDPAAIKAKNPNSGHTHIQGNLQVGDKGLVTDDGSTLTQGVIYGDFVRSRHYEPNSKIDPQRIDIGWTDYLHLRTRNIFPNYDEKEFVYHHGKHVWHDESHFNGTAKFNNKATFENAVLMPWTMTHNEAYIGDNWMKNMKSTTRGSLYREKDGRDLRIVK